MRRVLLVEDENCRDTISSSILLRALINSTFSKHSNTVVCHRPFYYFYTMKLNKFLQIVSHVLQVRNALSIFYDISVTNVRLQLR